jgi:hypothetical protein
LKPKIDHLEALEESLMKEAESAFKTRDGCSIGAKESDFQAPPAPMFGKGCNY